MFKRWFKKHKKLLIAFGITSVIFTILTSFQVSLLLNNLEDLKYYAETGNITNDMYTYAIITGLDILVGVFWFGLLAILIWKILFPSQKTVRNAFCLNELEFLINMPTSIKKELSRKNE